MFVNRQNLFFKEYKTAIVARAQGLEGRARVCARRAAAALIAEYLEREQIEHASMNSLELILYLQQQTKKPELAHLLGRYSKPVNVDHQLDEGIDLITSLTDLAKLLEINIGKEYE